MHCKCSDVQSTIINKNNKINRHKWCAFKAFKFNLPKVQRNLARIFKMKINTDRGNEAGSLKAD